MKSKFVAVSTAFLFVINTITPTALVFADVTPPNPLLKDIITLEAGVDSGQVKLEDAINTFSASVAQDNISIDSIETLAQTKMSPEQFEDFKTNLNSSLRGIDPSTLTQNELGSLVGQLISQTKTQGLYWDGCAVMYSGIALAVASVVVAVIGIVDMHAKSKIAAKQAELKASEQASIDSNNKSIASNDAQFNPTIQTYQQYQANSDASVDSQINTGLSNLQNWQTVYPQLVSTSQTQIVSDTAQITSLSAQLNTYYYAYGTNPATQSTYQQYLTQLGGQITTLQNELTGAESAIVTYTNKIATYTNNPAQVAIDAAALDASRDAQKAAAAANWQNSITTLENQRDQQDAIFQAQNATAENDYNSDLSQYASQQDGTAALGKNLAVGGGIGAAVTAAMIIVGANNSQDCGD